MLACVTIGYVDCALREKDFRRRRQLSPYTFFYHVEAMLAWAVVVGNVRVVVCGGFFFCESLALA